MSEKPYYWMTRATTQREWIERRGYGASIEAWSKMGYGLPQVGSERLNTLIDEKFCGWAYYRMSWNRGRVEKWFARHLEWLEAN